MSDFDRICEEGERISREEGYKVLLAEIAARDKEIKLLRLTDAEREAVQMAVAEFSATAPNKATILLHLLKRTK